MIVIRAHPRCISTPYISLKKKKWYLVVIFAGPTPDAPAGGEATNHRKRWQLLSPGISIHWYIYILHFPNVKMWKTELLIPPFRSPFPLTVTP